MKVIAKKSFLFVFLIMGLSPLQAGWHSSLSMPTFTSLPWLASLKAPSWITPFKSFLEDHQKPLVIGGTCLSVASIGGYLLYKKLVNSKSTSPFEFNSASDQGIFCFRKEPKTISTIDPSSSGINNSNSPSTSDNGAAVDPQDEASLIDPELPDILLPIPKEDEAPLPRQKRKVVSSLSKRSSSEKQKGKEVVDSNQQGSSNEIEHLGSSNSSQSAQPQVSINYSIGKDTAELLQNAQRELENFGRLNESACNELEAAQRQRAASSTGNVENVDAVGASDDWSLKPITEPIPLAQLAREYTQGSADVSHENPVSNAKSARSLEYDEMLRVEKKAQALPQNESYDSILTEEDNQFLEATLINGGGSQFINTEVSGSSCLEQEFAQAGNAGMMQSQIFEKDELSPLQVSTSETGKKRNKGKERLIDKPERPDSDSEGEGLTKIVLEDPTWEIKSFIEFARTCADLKPYQRAKVGGHDKDNNETAISYEEFDRAFDHYFEIIKNDKIMFNNAKNWVDAKLPQELINSFEKEKDSCWSPFVAKLILNSDSKVAIHGDIHGDIHSLVKYTQDLCDKGYINPETFEIVDQNFYMLFLGDLVDRGWYGPEVMYLIMRLKCANPYKVFMVRGNHEDFSISFQETRLGYNSFFDQIDNKYNQRLNFTGSQSSPIYTKISKFYETLPLALYLGCEEEKTGITNYFLCCHGGNELGFDPKPLLKHSSSIAFDLVEELQRDSAFNRLFEGSWFKKRASGMIETSAADIKSSLEGTAVNYIPTSIMAKVNGVCCMIGFQWNDYEVKDSSQTTSLVERVDYRGWLLGEAFSDALRLAQSTPQHIIRGTFRAHQHCPNPKNPMMKRMLNSDNKGHDCNIGVAHIWLTEDHKDHPHALHDNDVITFCVSPNAHCQKLLTRTKEGSGQKVIFDTYGMLTTAQDFKEWQLHIHTLEMDLPDHIIDLSAGTKDDTQEPSTSHQSTGISHDEEELEKAAAEFVTIENVNDAEHIEKEFVTVDVQEIKISENLKRFAASRAQYYNNM